MTEDCVIKLETISNTLRVDPELALQQAEREIHNQPKLGEFELELLLIASRANIHMGRYGEGERHAKKALSLSSQHGYRRLEGLAYNELGIYSFIHFKVEDALLNYSHAQQILESAGKKQDRAKVQTNLGNVYMRQRNYFHATQCYSKALELIQDGADVLLETKTLMNLSSLYLFVLHDLETAADYIDQAIEKFRILKDRVGLAKALNNKAHVELKKGNNEESSQLYYEALEHCKSYSEPIDLALNYTGLASVLIEQQKFSQAEEIVEEAIDYLVSIDKESYCNYLLLPKARIYLNKGLFDDAWEVTAKMREWVELNRMDDFVISILTTESMILEAKGDYREANAVLSNIIELNDSTMQEQARLRLMFVKQQIEYIKEVGKEEFERNRNTELTTTINRLKAAVHENEEYMAFLAHELKSPLSTIRSVAGLLVTDTDITTTEGREYSTEILTIATRMFDMVTRMLTGSKIRITRDTMSSDACVVLKHIVVGAGIASKQKGIHFDCVIPDAPMMVDADEQALHLIFENLITNAIKFTPIDGSVSVLLKSIAPFDSGAAMVFCVSDTGPGISKKDQLLLFQPFMRLSAKPTSNESSSGLGLHLVRRAADQIGARLWCKSELTCGSTFFVELPMAAEEV